ncbi:MAG: response regulator transcription factor [Chloroflexota bacterium]
MGTIKVLLVEDHTIVRKGIRSLLDAETGIDVVGEAENGREAIEKAENLHPDIVLMDHTMPILSGLEATRQIKKLLPNVRILILTMHTNEEYILQFLQAGALGYLVKQTAPTELISAVQTVYRGDFYLNPATSQAVIEEYLRLSKATKPIQDSYDKLTNREREVLQLITEGFSNKEIAAQLQISLKTVGVHRVNLMEKLNIHNVTDLVKYALRKGIIGLD